VTNEGRDGERRLTTAWQSPPAFGPEGSSRAQSRSPGGSRTRPPTPGSASTTAAA